MASLNSRSTTFAFSWFRPDGRAGHGRSRAAVLLAAGGVLALLGWPDGAGAVEVNTGFVGIAPGQVAQLNVEGISSPDIFPNPAAGACRVRLTLRAARCAEGEACAIGDPNIFEISSPEILPGEAVFLRVSAVEIGLSGRGERALVRGTLEARCRQASAAAALKVTLEIYDADTGRTAVVLGPANSASGRRRRERVTRLLDPPPRQPRFPRHQRCDGVRGLGRCVLRILACDRVLL
jgi:hypothetical protein